MKEPLTRNTTPVREPSTGVNSSQSNLILATRQGQAETFPEEGKA
jgi:hypothetical protein